MRNLNGYHAPQNPLEAVIGYRQMKKILQNRGQVMPPIDGLSAFQAALAVQDAVPFIYDALTQQAGGWQELTQSTQALIELHKAYNLALQADFDALTADLAPVLATFTPPSGSGQVGDDTQ